MRGTSVAIPPLLSLSALGVMSPLDARANPANPEDVAHIKAAQTKVHGVVTQRKSGLYTVRTAWITQGNDILDASKKKP